MWNFFDFNFAGFSLSPTTNPSLWEPFGYLVGNQLPFSHQLKFITSPFI
jgi:hypothetical protein